MILRMRILFFILIGFLTLAHAEKVIITSDKFEGDQRLGIMKFIGNVHMRKSRDKLDAATVTVYFNNRKKATRYEAVGNAHFEIYMLEKGTYYVGKANRMVYKPQTQVYEFYGDVVLREPKLDRTLTGDKVIVRRLDGKVNVTGNRSRPVKFIFKVQEKKHGR